MHIVVDVRTIAPQGISTHINIICLGSSLQRKVELVNIVRS